MVERVNFHSNRLVMQNRHVSNDVHFKKIVLEPKRSPKDNLRQVVSTLARPIIDGKIFPQTATINFDWKPNSCILMIRDNSINLKRLYLPPNVFAKFEKTLPPDFTLHELPFNFTEIRYTPQNNSKDRSISKSS